MTIGIPVKNAATTNLTVALPSGGNYGPVYTTNAQSTNAQWANAASPTSGKIHVQGDAVFEGKITWQGRDMREWFEAVENRLGMLRPNPKIEEGWDELKALGDQYRALEKRLTEQQQVFDILRS